jgi:hypothetical protein
MTYVEILQTETIKRTLYPDYRSNTVLVLVRDSSAVRRHFSLMTEVIQY